MKKIFFILILIVFIAGCTDSSGILAQFGVGEPRYTKTESISIKGETIPQTVYGGENTRLYFSLANSGNITLNNVYLNVIDSCALYPGGQSKLIGRLEPTEIEDWNWRVSANNVQVERNCGVLYRTSYNSRATALYEIAALSEDEYLRLKKQGKMKDKVSINYYKTKSPLNIKMDISRDQPLISGNEFYLDLQIKNAGNGKVPGLKLPPGSITIDHPNFLRFMGCNDFNYGGGRLTLSKELKFFDGQTKKMSCKFKVGRNLGIKQISQFKVDLRYKYQINKVINVKVKP